MKVLITGVNGFVGRALYKHLSKNYKTIGVGRQVDLNDNMLYNADLRDEKSSLSFFENYKGGTIDTIIHLASRTANKDNVNDLSVLNDNTAMSKNIALAAKHFGVKHIIHLSSSSVYSNVTGVFNEGSLTDPSANSDCIYGLSKLNSEIVLNYFAGAEISITHLRATMIYGPDMEESRIIPVLENEIRTNNTATVFGNGERLLNLIHIDKLIEVITYFINDPANGVFNTGDECISLIDLAKSLITKLDKPQTVIVLKPQGSRNKFELDFSKLSSFMKNKKHV